ncbi:unnamed protein product, partial [Polarella glacialis]
YLLEVMVQGGKMGLNKNKQQKSHHKVKKISKVDIHTKAKKATKSGSALDQSIHAFQRKTINKTEANVAAKAQVEGSAHLHLISVTTQQLAHAKKTTGGKRNKNKK